MCVQFLMRAKNAFLTSIALNVLAIVFAQYLLPARTALHFNAQGFVDRWGSHAEFILINLFLVITTYYAIEYGAKLALKFPKILISLPNKDYWLSPEKRPVAEQKLTDYLRYFGMFNVLYQTIVLGLIIVAHQHTPVRLNAPVMAGLTLVFLLITGFWCVRLYRAFKRVTP